MRHMKPCLKNKNLGSGSAVKSSIDLGSNPSIHIIANKSILHPLPASAGTQNTCGTHTNRQNTHTQVIFKILYNEVKMVLLRAWLFAITGLGFGSARWCLWAGRRAISRD